MNGTTRARTLVTGGRAYMLTDDVADMLRALGAAAVEEGLTLPPHAVEGWLNAATEEIGLLAIANLSGERYDA